MSKCYIYNLKTHTLHIEGYCHYAKKGLPVSMKVFNSENEALAYDGRSVRLCKLCQKQREKEK